MGGFILLLLFIRHPDRIAALVAANTGSGAHPPTINAFIQKTLNASERVINEWSIPPTIWRMLENVFNWKKDLQSWVEFRDHLAELLSIISGYTLKYVQATRPS